MNNYQVNSIYLAKRKVNQIFSLIEPSNFAEIFLEDFIHGIKQGRWKSELTEFRSLDSEERRREFKVHSLPAVTLSGTFGTTKEDSLQQHSGMLQIDIDLKTKEDRDNFYSKYRECLCQDPYMVAVFDSPSMGVKGIFHMGLCSDKEEHKERAAAVLEYLRATYQISDQILDSSTLNLGRRFSVSYDPNAYINWDADDFSQSDLVRIYLEKLKNTSLTRSNPPSLTTTGIADFSCTKKEKNIAKKFLEKACAKINTSIKGQRNATRIRQAYWIGGYAHYFDGEEALQQLIHTAQSNCSSREKAKQDIVNAYRKGQKNPLRIESKSNNKMTPEIVNQIKEDEISKFYSRDNQESRTVIPKGKHLSDMLEAQHYAAKTVTNLVASTGAGKMFAIREIQRRTAERVIYVSPLVRLVEQATKDLNAVGYMDALNGMPKAKIFATTINSLCTPKQNISRYLQFARQQQAPYKGKPIVLVLDEVHQIAERLFDPYCETNYADLVEFCRKYVSRVITLTATETLFSRAFTKQLAKDIEFAEQRYLFQKTANKISLQHLNLSKNHVLPQVLDILKEKQPNRAVILLQSKNKTEKLANSLLNELQVEPDDLCVVNADRDTPLNQGLKYIVGSPSLATGISFTEKVDLFILVTEDSIFSPEDLEQYTARVRDAQDTEFYLITMKHKLDKPIRYQSKLECEQLLLKSKQIDINEEIEREVVKPSDAPLIKMLDYDWESQSWRFHPLYTLLHTSKKAFNSYCISVGVVSFVEYLKNHPHPDFSFEIKNIDLSKNISQESLLSCQNSEKEFKEERVAKMENAKVLNNIAAYNSATMELKSLQIQPPSRDSQEQEEREQKIQELPFQLKKTEAHLLGVDTTGLDIQRCKEAVTKAYRYATLMSLLTMRQLPDADTVYRKMMTRWAKADYSSKLYTTTKWKFTRKVLAIMRMDKESKHQLQTFENILNEMGDVEFESIFGLKKAEQNLAEVMNKFGLVFTDPKRAWQTMGVDHRVYRDVIQDLVGSLECVDEKALARELREFKDKMEECSDSEQLRQWYNEFILFIKIKWPLLAEHQASDWTWKDNKQAQAEKQEQRETKAVNELLNKVKTRRGSPTINLKRENMKMILFD